MLKKCTREEKSWIFYDWANSGFATLIAAIILPIFFRSVATGDGISNVNATAYWGYATSAGTLICALCAPFLGAIGDYQGMKKKLFTAALVLGVISTALLAFTGSWQLLLIFYVTGTIGFNASCIYYDSFLLDVTSEERMDMISTLGYGMGYIGGSTIPLILSLALIQFGGAIGIETVTATRLSFILTAVWWVVFTIPMLKNVRQRHSVPHQPHLVRHTLGNLRHTLSLIVKNRSVFFFLIAYFFYIDGVGTIIHMATIFGDSCGLGSMEMMLVLLVVQIVAFPFAILYGRLAGKFGARTMILVGIITYCIVCVVGFGLRQLSDFIMLAILVGTAQGGIQALSRSFYGKLVPKEHASEFFGFYDIFGKFSAVIGPALFGAAAQLTGKTNFGVLAVMAMFFVGGGIFAFLVPANAEKMTR